METKNALYRVSGTHFLKQNIIPKNLINLTVQCCSMERQCCLLCHWNYNDPDNIFHIISIDYRNKLCSV